MFKVLLKPLTLSHMDANGLSGTTKVSIFQPLQIYDTINYRVHHTSLGMVFIFHSKLNDRKDKTCTCAVMQNTKQHVLIIALLKVLKIYFPNQLLTRRDGVQHEGHNFLPKFNSFWLFHRAQIEKGDAMYCIYMHQSQLSNV